MPLPSITESYQKAWRAIIEPLKIEYSMNDLGPQQFSVNQNVIKRADFTLTNKYGNELACSFFENTSLVGPAPCVIYLHANGSCRLEALQYKQVILASRMHYFCFDFTACGHSTGKYGSVGYFERDDLERVIAHLNETQKITKIALWGRSMGAVTAIMYSAKNSNIACVVLDSPFAKFKRLVHELVKSRANVPKLFTSMVLGMLRKKVKKKANFDVFELKPIEYVKELKMPALFGAPKDDTFVSPQHTKDLYMAHSGQKKLSTFEGDHNSQRPIEWVMCVMEFIKTQLHSQENSFKGMDALNNNTPKKIFDDLPIRKPEWEKPTFIQVSSNVGKDF